MRQMMILLISLTMMSYVALHPQGEPSKKQECTDSDCDDQDSESKDECPGPGCPDIVIQAIDEFAESADEENEDEISPEEEVEDEPPPRSRQ